MAPTKSSVVPGETVLLTITTVPFFSPLPTSLDAEIRAVLSGSLFASIGVPTVNTTKPDRVTASTVSPVRSSLPDASALARRSSISWDPLLRIGTSWSWAVSLTAPADRSAFRMQPGQKVSRPTLRRRIPQLGHEKLRTRDDGKRFLLCSTIGDLPACSCWRELSFLS